MTKDTRAAAHTTEARASVAAKATPQENRRVTSYDVALLAGVSQSAVSRCFKPGASVSKATYARVMKAAQGLDYIPNAAARSLITRRSNLVAVIISSRAHLQYPEALAELSKHIGRCGKRALLFTLTRDSDIEHILSDVWNYQVDGAIAAAPLSEAQVAEFARRRVPLVMFNRSAGQHAAPAVLCDQQQAAAMLVTRLAAAGHRQFALIDGPPESRLAQQRQRGAQRRIAELGLPALLAVSGRPDYASGAQALRQIIARLGRAPDAVLCGNDALAIGCLETARTEFGIAVPERMSVVGMNAAAPGAWRHHKLSTLQQPVAQMASAAADMLIAIIDNQAQVAEQRLFNAELIIGATARLDAGAAAAAAPQSPWAATPPLRVFA